MDSRYDRARRNGSAPHPSAQILPLKRDIPVLFVLQPRASIMDIAAAGEVLRRANIQQDAINFCVRYVGVTRTVTTCIGIRLHPVEPLPSSLPDNAIVIMTANTRLASEWGRPADYEADDQDQDVIVDWLRDSIRPSHTVIAICTGALLLGRAGLLDGRRCTTHYLDCANLARLAPKAKVVEDRLFVNDANIYTCAGVTAGIDLMLHLISTVVGHTCAVAVARHLVVYMRRAGSDPQISPWLEGRNHLHPAVHRVQDAIAENPAHRWTRTQLARVAGTSGRHLSRLFQQQVGMPLVDYRNRLRVAVARELVLQSELDMEKVAQRSGFSSTRQLRRAWQRVYIGSPSEARTAASRFASAAAD